MAEEEPKIHVDSDWKLEAQREKEKLAQTADQKAGQAQELPPASFEQLISLLATQAIMNLGSKDPKTGQLMVALDLAKFNIDLIAVLEEKTKGNLNEQEASALTATLRDLRLAYADMSKMVAQATAEGKVAYADPSKQTPPSTDTGSSTGGIELG